MNAIAPASHWSTSPSHGSPSDDGTVAPAGRVARAIALLQHVERELLPATLAFSGGAEDMVLLDLIARHAPAIEAFLLDTGRLHAETHALLSAAEAHYRRRIAVYLPDAQAVESYVRLNGINGFYGSVAQRQACCHVRKVQPLRRALDGKRAWITGQRREQALSRFALAAESFDDEHRLAKFNPLAEWTAADVDAYVAAHGVPVHALHAHGYPSIGCAPCTRAIQPGEPPRAGRWWWEDGHAKECGLHAVSLSDAGVAERTQ